jgi:hypothetical protein
VGRFVKAKLDAIQYMKRNKAETVAVLIEFTKVDRHLAELTFDDMVPVMPDDGSINVKGVEPCKNIFARSARKTAKLPRRVSISWTRFVAKRAK